MNNNISETARKPSELHKEGLHMLYLPSKVRSRRAHTARMRQQQTSNTANLSLQPAATLRKLTINHDYIHLVNKQSSDQFLSKREQRIVL